MGFGKPDKRAYRAIAEALDCSLDECLHVGDNLKLDFEMPAELGMQAIHIDRNQPSDPPYRIITLEDLPTLVINYYLHSGASI